jgi:hypothetical protein
MENLIDAERRHAEPDHRRLSLLNISFARFQISLTLFELEPMSRTNGQTAGVTHVSGWTGRYAENFPAGDGEGRES